MDDVTLGRMADLIVGFGANVQPGQIVGLSSQLGKEDLTRAIVAAAYDRGAHFVDVVYHDPWVKRARISHATDEALDVLPPWFGERALAIGRLQGANISLSGPVAPEALQGLDPVRIGRDRYPRVQEWLEVVNARTANWCVAPAPSPGWASLVRPDSEPAEALRLLEEELLYVLRLDEADPIAAWKTRINRLKEVGARLSERRFDAIHLEGPGTDLLVGLLPTSAWAGASETTVFGVSFLPNLPTEEIFTTPDPERVDGHVTATKPLDIAGSLIRGIRVRFEGGRAVAIDADEGADVLRGRAAVDDGAARLGELALVDGEGRIGRLGTVFYDTLLDENAASHIALGGGFDWAVAEEDRARINRSAIHIDFMIGSPEVDVTGVTREGEHVPLLREGAWQI